MVKKKENAAIHLTKTPQQIRAIAERYYKTGQFYCSEAIMQAFREAVQEDIPAGAVAMASGFPVGMGGAGCMCGTIAGGTMVLGLAFGRTVPGDPGVKKAMLRTRQLTDHFKEKNRSACCRILTSCVTMESAEQMEQCVRFTGEVAEKTAELIIQG
jgi:C_GCAxxG_C_C family probable redox protein